jgi:hypothetical protein
VFSYELSESDYKLIDRVEVQLYEKIDNNPNISADAVVDLINSIIEKKKLDGQIKTILQVIVQDLSVDYVWDSADDDLEEEYEMIAEDCFEDEHYDEEWKYCYIEINDGEYIDDDDLWDDYIDDDFDGAGSWEIDIDYEMKASDCLKDEKYDEEWKYCYIEVEGDFDENDTQFDEEKQGYKDVWGNESNNEEAWWGEENSVIYKINGDNIKLIKWDADKKHNEIWKLFITLIPKNYRTDFANYGVSNEPNGDTFAHVVQNNSDNNKWDIGVNMWAFYQKGKLDKKESIHTLIHEFAHVFTLNKTQMQYIPNNLESEAMMKRFRGKCKTNLVMEGCLYKDSYLNQFIDKFWKEDFKKLEAAGEEEQLDFYTGKENNFVSDYAASNPGEGIAETFTFFVLKPKPTGNTIADQKVRFFYNFPKAVQLRTLIRARLDKIK